MLAVSKAIHARVVADTGAGGLVTFLGTYNDAPSFFTSRPVPIGAGFPIGLAVTVPVDVDLDTINANRREYRRDVAFYGESEATGSGTLVSHFRKVEQAAERFRELFHRQSLTLTGTTWTVMDCRCVGPIDAPAEANESGKIVTLVLRLQKP